MTRFRFPQKNPQKIALIIVIAAGLILLIDRFVREWSAPRIPQPEVKEHALSGSEVRDFTSALSILDQAAAPRTGQVHLFTPQPESVPAVPPVVEETPPEEPSETVQAPSPAPVPEPALPPPATGAPGKIVIIIDDLGMDRKRSNAMIDMDAPLTLAFLPYASGLPEMTARAKEKGHELLIHMPMEPLNGDLDPGPLVLKGSMSGEEIQAALEQAFSSFGGYVGINNHMGSKLTQDRAAMDKVMEELKKRDLLFVDSKTIGSSVAADSAARHGLEYGKRDVFLDNVNDFASVMRALRQTETVARRRGVAIAIGHPHDATIEALRQWLPTLKGRNLEIVPVSAAVRRENAETVSIPAPEPVSVTSPATSEPFGPPSPPPE